MEQVVPWAGLQRLIAPGYPEAGTGRHPYPLATMLRVYPMQNRFSLSDPAMEGALYDMPALRQFARLSSLDAIPDETTIPNFRHLIEEYDLAQEIFGSVVGLLQRRGLMLKECRMVDATIIDAPSSTKNDEGQRNPEMRQTKKGDNYYLGMKAHIGVDVDSGLTHTAVTTPASESDVAQVAELLHGKEKTAHGDSGHTGAHACVEIPKLTWGVCKRRSQVENIAHAREQVRALRREKRKVQVRAFVEHPVRIVKCVFGYRKLRYKGLLKNTAQVLTLFALANLYMARKLLMPGAGKLRPQFGKGGENPLESKKNSQKPSK